MRKGIDNLKTHGYVRDNISGLVCHTLALAACGYVLAIEYEKPTDDAFDVVKNLMIQTFSIIGSLLSTAFVYLHVDRGQWSRDAVTLLTQSCCKTCGTTKRMP